MTNMVISASVVTMTGVDYSDKQRIPDPSDFSINGELATPEELEALEKLACELLEGALTETYYEYGYMTDDGLSVLFGTVEKETDNGISYHGRISMNQGDFEDPFFYLEVDSENSVDTMLISAEVGVDGVIASLQKIMDEVGQLPEAELNLLRHMQTVLLKAQYQDLIDDIEEAAPELRSEEFPDHKLIDYLHDMAKERSPLGIATKEVSPLPNHALYVCVRWYVSSRDDVEVPDDESPQLEIGVWDASAGLHYKYTSQVGNPKTLEISDANSEDDDTVVFTEDDDEVEELLKEAGVNAPSKKDVGRISKMLSQTWLYMNNIAPDVLGDDLTIADE